MWRPKNGVARRTDATGKYREKEPRKKELPVVRIPVLRHWLSRFPLVLRPTAFQFILPPPAIQVVSRLNSENSLGRGGESAPGWWGGSTVIADYIRKFARNPPPARCPLRYMFFSRIDLLKRPPPRHGRSIRRGGGRNRLRPGRPRRVTFSISGAASIDSSAKKAGFHSGFRVREGSRESVGDVNRGVPPRWQRCRSFSSASSPRTHAWRRRDRDR